MHTFFRKGSSMLPITKRGRTLYILCCDHFRNDKMVNWEPNKTLMPDGKEEEM